MLVEAMTPYYEDEWVTIYHGDALEVVAGLEAGSIDVVFTDPPYNVSDRNGRDATTVGRLKRKDGTARKVWRDFGAWDRGWDPEPFVAEAVRLLRDGGSLLSFVSEFTLAPFLASGLNHRGLVYWRKSNPTPAFRQLYVRAIEMIVWQVKTDAARKQSWTWNATGYRPNVYDGPVLAGFNVVNGAEPRTHPTQKPLWLIRSLLGVHSAPGELILDPYMGSGTTLHAAKSMGRRALGVEANEKHCERAAIRCSQEVLGLSA